MKKTTSKFTIILLAVYLLLLTGVVVFKLPFFRINVGTRIVNWHLYLGVFSSGRVSVDVIYNIIFFIPLGIFIGMLNNASSFFRKLAPIVALTLVYEATQYIFAIGTTDITDIINNTLGGVIGVVIYSLIYKIFGTKANKVLNAIVSIFVATALLFIVFMFWRSRQSVMIPIII